MNNLSDDQLNIIAEKVAQLIKPKTKSAVARDSSDYFAIVTDKGQELINTAYGAGKVVTLDKMAFGDSGGAYVAPDPSFTALVSEFGRQDIMAGGSTDAAISASAVVDPTYAGNVVREFGLFDVDGNLIVYGSYPESLIIDASGSSYMQLEVAVDMYITNASAVSIVVNPVIDYATEDTPGIVERATAAEVQAGTDNLRYITSAHLKDQLPLFATKDQAWAGTSKNTIITPETLAAAAPQKDQWGITTFPGDLVYKKDGRKHLSLMNSSGTHEMYLYAEDGAVSLNMGDQAATEILMVNGLITVMVGGKSFKFYGSGSGSGNFASQGDVIAFEGATRETKDKKENSNFYPDSMPIDPETHDLIHIMRVLAWHVDELRDLVELNMLDKEQNDG